MLIFFYPFFFPRKKKDLKCQILFSGKKDEKVPLIFRLPVNGKD